jgi:hypothetical protein
LASAYAEETAFTHGSAPLGLYDVFSGMIAMQAACRFETQWFTSTTAHALITSLLHSAFARAVQ